jgi:diguanylate cyclase (GGDEF)-like protein
MDGPVVRNSRRLSLALILIALLVLGSTGSVIFYALTALAGRTDQIEKELTASAGRAALRALETRLGDINREFSHGDDVQNPRYGVSLFDWRVDDLCASTRLGVNFDIAFLVNEAMQSLAGCVDGRRISVDPTQAMGRALAPIIRDISAPTRRKSVRTGFMHTGFGVAAIAVGSAWWSQADISGAPAIIVVGKRLDENSVKRMSRDFNIPGLRLVTDLSEVNPAAAVREPDGRIIASLAWTPRSLGKMALNEILPTVLANLLFLAVAFAAMIGAVWWAFQAVHDSNKKSAHAAVHDSLTGLPNRAALIAMLDGLSHQKDQEGSVIFIDLDGFKEVNDFYGHEIGDRLLKGFGAGLATLVGDQGLVARVGGDEFVVLLTGSAVKSSAHQLAAAAIALSAEPLRVGPHSLKIQASVGLASSNFENVTGEELLRRADLAMYEAKRRGGSNIAVYSHDIDAGMKKRMKMAEEIRQGIKNREFRVVCQPIVDAGDLKPVAMEILARWKRADGVVVAPEEFIKVAEEHSLIDELGKYLLEQGCAVAGAHRNLRFSVNVSALQMRSMEFLGVVDRTLQRFAIEPARLQIEMTESKILLDGTILRPVIDGLKSRGIQLVLDDFGTGYASIAYLRQFRFDGLKLDRSICSEVCKSVNALMMAQGMILVAKAAGLEVVAEGVENKEQANLLKLAGCTHLQGYLFGAPQEITQGDWLNTGLLEASASPPAVIAIK